MRRSSRLSTPGLLTRHAGTSIAGSLLVALLIAAAVLAAALAPRALGSVGTAELRHAIAKESPVLLDLTGMGRLGFPANLPMTASIEDVYGASDQGIRAIRDALPEPLRTNVGQAEWVASTTGSAGELPNDLPLTLSLGLAVDLDWQNRIRFVDGVAPEAWSEEGSQEAPPGEATGEQTPIPIAISKDAAARLQLGIGSLITFSPSPAIVIGIYEPLDPEDAFWVHFPNLSGVTLEDRPGQPTTARLLAYVDPLTIMGLQQAFATGPLTAVFEISPRGMDYADAALLQTQVRQLLATDQPLPLAGTLEFRSGLPEVVARVVQRVTSASSLLALSVSGLLGVLLAVFALSVQSVIARRRPALALAAARGAGSAELRAAMVLEGALLSAPGAVIGFVIASVLVPGRIGVEGWVLPALVALAPPVLFGVLTSPRQLRNPRGDLQLRSRSGVRWIVEIVVAALAALSLFLLARRGLVASSDVVGIDPLLAATPLLLSAAVCIGVLRLYPALLLGVQRGLRRRRGSAGVLGAARAIRDPALGFSAALALVVGISIVVFSTAMATTIRSGLVQGARDVVGADVQVRAPMLSAPLLEKITAVDGVARAAAIAVVSGIDLNVDSDAAEVFIVITDTDALHEVRPDIPAIATKVGDRIPLLVSSDLAERVDGADLGLGPAPAYNSGTVPADAIPGVTRYFVLIDSAYASAIGVSSLAPQRVLIRLDAGATASAVAPEVQRVVAAAQAPESSGRVVVSTADSLLAENLSSPIVASLESALLLAALASLLLTMLTVVLASVAAATARNRLVGVLRILGMSPRQLRAVQAWELGPIALTAVVVGTALGLVLPLIVTAALDLRPFVGGRLQPGPNVEPLWVLAAIGSFSIVVILAGIIAAALGRRFAPAGTLKMGEG